jgi:hypothetical protein
LFAVILGSDTGFVTANTASGAVSASNGYLARRGTHLVLGGAPYRVVGLDAYELASYWGSNAGCGGMVDDSALDAFFASFPPGSMVRIWGFQGSMATNPVTRQRDWTGLDRVVAAAQRHGDLLVVSLANQPGDCDDGHWKDRAWYAGGYRNVYPGNGYTIATVSYWDWVHEIVTRYRDSTAIGMWELVNEPEATDCSLGANVSNCYGHQICPDSYAATAAMRAFFDTVGNEIKHIDPHHLVESGVLGGAQCGWVGAGYTAAQASSGIDVVSVHEYFESPTLSSDLRSHLAAARSLGKPLLVGELGVHAADGNSSCRSIAARSDLLTQKTRNALAAGAAGVLIWDWIEETPPSSCSYDVTPSDLVLRQVGPA